MTRAAKIGLRIGVAALLLAALALLVLVGALVWLQSERGERRVRTELVARLNDQLAGRVEAGSLSLSPSGVIELEDLALYDPEGGLVARIGRLRAEAALWALLGREVHLRDVRFSDADLLLVQQPEGLNLVRAVEPREPAPSKPGSSTPSAWSVRVDGLHAEDFHVDYRDAPGAAPVAALDGLTIDARGRYAVGESRLEFSAGGEAQAPVTAPFSLALSATAGSRASGWEPIAIQRGEVSIGDTRLVSNWKIDSERIVVALESLLLGRAQLLALFPEVPFAADLLVTGGMMIADGRMTADLSLPVGQGRLGLDGSMDFSPFAAQVTGRMEKLDLAALFTGPPPSALNGTFDARFSAGSPAPGAGRLELALGPSTVRGVPIESLGAAVRSEGERAIVDQLTAVIAGGRVEASGTLDAVRLDVRSSAEVSSIGVFAMAVAGLAGAEAPELAGSGRLEARLSGPYSAPALTVEAGLARIEAGPFDARGVRLVGRMPDASRPFVFAADLAAGKGTLGGQAFHDLRAIVDANRRAFTAKLSSAGLAGLSAQLDGELDQAGTGGRIDKLLLSLGGARWALLRPVRLGFVDGFRADRLVLCNGDQRLELEGGVRRERLEAELRASQIDLSKLPRVLVPEALRLAGVVDAEARLSGTTRKPSGSVEARFEALGVAEYRGISGTAAVALGDRQRVSGTAALRRDAATVNLDFELPLDLARARADAPISARVRVGGESLAQLASALQLEDLAVTSGTLGIDATLSGTVGRPRAELAARADRVRAVEVEGDVAIRAELGEGSRAEATLALSGGTVEIEATTGLALTTLLRRPPTAEEFQAMAFEATLRAPAFALESLAGGLLPADVRGRASVEAELHGSLAQPRGAVRVAVADGAWSGWQQLAATATLTAGDTEVAFAGELGARGQPLAKIDGEVQGSVEALRALESPEQLGLRAELAVGPAPLPPGLGPIGRALTGTVTINARLGGSLGKPELSGSGQVADVRVGEDLIGGLEGRVTYAAGKLSVEASTDSHYGGGATLSGELQADLGLESLRRGLDPMAAPLQAHLEARELNLKVVDLFSDALRQTAGVLSASLDLGGTLGAPIPRGKAALRNGQFAPIGYGSYREVGFDLAIGDRVLELTGLTARSGRGQLTGQARASRPGEGTPWQLGGALRVDQFPVTVNDQVLALLTGHTDQLVGQLQGLRMALDVRLARMVVNLPELSSEKELQELEANPDIFIVTGEKRQIDQGRGPQAGQGLDLRIHLAAPNNIRVLSDDMRIDAGADVTLAVVGGKVEMSGEIIVVQARADIIGRRFELNRGRLSWAGDPIGNPKLDIQAVHENARENVKVNVGITGSASNPRLDLTSEPPLDESQIVTLLATGSRELKRGSGGIASTGRAASVLGSLAADRLRRVISSQLPLDVLQVEVGEQGPQSTKLEAGTYVTDRIYVGYRRNFGAVPERGENPNEVRVEYQITPSLSIESSYGDAQRGGADLVFSRDY